MTASALTAQQREEVRAIATEVVIAASRVQAAHAACEAIDRYRVSAPELAEFLSELAPGEASPRA